MNAPLEQLQEIDQKNREIADDLTAAKSYTAHVRHQIGHVASTIWEPTGYPEVESDYKYF